MKKLSLYLLLSIMAWSVQGKIPQTDEIDKIFAEWDKPNSPGGAIGIIKNGEMIFARGYGMANLEYDIANSPQSVFRIASTSKQFTAASIILLAQQGKLSLDDKLSSFFPEFPDYAKSITIKHLLNHTSGIRDYLTLAYLAGLNENDFYTDKEVLKLLVEQERTNFPPGEKFLYSNSGYWLLGQIVGKVYGEDMAVFAQKEIFSPLKMNNTHFHNDHNRIVKNRATGYTPKDKNEFQISMTTLDMIGDGGIFTSIEEIKKWDDAFYDSKILNQEFWKMMTTPGLLNNGEQLDYAAGLGIREHNGLKVISHGGAFVGYRAELIRFPEQKLSVAIFANRADADPSAKGFKIADLFLKDEYLKKAEPQNKIEKASTEIQLTNKELQRWAGDYWYNDDAYSRKLYLKENALYYFRSENSESKLVALSKNEFTIEGDDRVRISFAEDSNQVKTLSFSVDGNLPSVAISYQPINYDKEELKKFSGSFFSPELNVTYDLKMKDNELFLFINDNEVSAFKSIKENLLVNDRYGSFSFNLDKSSNISDFKLAAGRVKELHFIKK